MATFDIFRGNAFSTTALTSAFRRNVVYEEQYLGSLGIFESMPVRNRAIFVERATDGGIVLIPTSPDGAPPEELGPDTRDLVPLRTTRLTKGFTLYARELQDIRAFGSESEMMTVQGEYMARAAKVRRDMEATHELHRLGALQGKLLDADGVSVIYDYFDMFEISEAPYVDFPLRHEDSDSVNLRMFFTQFARNMLRAGVLTPGARIGAIVGDEFYDLLVTHPQIEKLYMGWAGALELRNPAAPFQAFSYAGIEWHNYRGLGDDSPISIAPDEVRFFPIGMPDVFKKAMGPHESIEWVNTPGIDTYLVNILDRDRNMWTRGELYSYPLYFCQQPDKLRRGRIAT